ncbi:glycosyltransferase [Paenibacillus chitinolyticus]|uniref:glycosyltransferase n=1 Tax=Paenibacillus chitinolyticus TaxID=79263 RepID=UPI00366C4A38
MNDISVCMIVKNEMDLISKSIKSVIPHVGEVIVVDHSSTDLTKKTAELAGAKVYERQWTQHFADARNYSLSKANYSYILVLDADEEFIGDSQTLRDACTSMRHKNGCASRVKIESLTASGDTSSAYITRLFPNTPEFNYKGRIHEQLLFNSASPRLLDSSVRIKHYGYTSMAISTKDKLNRNLDILRLELQEKPDDAYILFQVGRTLSLKGDYVQAKWYLNESLNRLSAPYPNFHSNLLLEYLNLLVKMQKWNEFLKIMTYALEIYPDYTDLYYRYGTAIIETGKAEWFHEIPHIFTACLRIGEVIGSKYESVQGVGSFRAHYNLGLYYELTGNKKLAVIHYTRSWESGFDRARERLLAVTNTK